MFTASPQSHDLAPGLTHWWASASHPMPPAAGSYVLVDGEPFLAATAPGPIVAVLVLPNAQSQSAAALPLAGDGWGLPGTRSAEH
jgi:hypothetical protein